MPYRLANLNVAIAEAHESTLDLDVNIADSPDSVTEYLSLQLSPLVAEERTISSVMDIAIARGVQVGMGVLIVGTHERTCGLQVYVKSAELTIGASAIYNPDGDEVESVLYVEDGDTLHPEFIEEMRAILLYRAKHDMGTVSFDYQMGNADGTVVNVWIHPAHISDLSVRYIGIVREIGAVDFTVPVIRESTPEIPLGENVLEGVDIETSRTEPSTPQALVHNLDAAPEEVETLHTDVVITLFKLNLLSQYEYIEVGNGPVYYEGGGNRLLTSLNDDGFVFQPKGNFPPDLNAHTYLEGAGSNLLTNANFLTPTSSSNLIPQGWSVNAPSSVTILPDLITDSSGVNVFKLRALGSGKFVSAKVVAFVHDASIVANDTDPLTLSALARVEYNYYDDVSVDSLSLVISYRDGTDSELSKEIITFDPDVIVGDNFILLQHTVATPPTGTVAVRVSFELESVDANDDITLYLMVPQLETGVSATSRIAGATAPTNRLADDLWFPQGGNIEFRKGSIITIISAAYDGYPAADACLFDTRDASGQNGFAAYHLSDGRLRFVVAGPISDKVITSSDLFAFQAAIFYEIGVSWARDFMQIQLNSEVVAEDSTTVVLPQAFNEFIYLLRDTTGGARLDGELATFEIRRDIQQ